MLFSLLLLLLLIIDYYFSPTDVTGRGAQAISIKSNNIRNTDNDTSDTGIKYCPPIGYVAVWFRIQNNFEVMLGIKYIHSGSEANDTSGAALSSTSINDSFHADAAGKFDVILKSESRTMNSTSEQCSILEHITRGDENYVHPPSNVQVLLSWNAITVEARSGVVRAFRLCDDSPGEGSNNPYHRSVTHKCREFTPSTLPVLDQSSPLCATPMPYDNLLSSLTSISCPGCNSTTIHWKNIKNDKDDNVSIYDDNSGIVLYFIV